MRTYREMLDRVTELKRSWADATGDSPEDYQLSTDDWRVGLDDEEATELVELLAFIDEYERKREPGDDSLHLGVLSLDEHGLIPCPDYECEGHVVEVDVAVRWNDLTVYDGDVFASTAGQYDFKRREEEGFICSSCLRPIRSEVLDKATITYT